VPYAYGCDAKDKESIQNFGEETSLIFTWGIKKEINIKINFR
jgi:hypothetical protein